MPKTKTVKKVDDVKEEEVVETTQEEVTAEVKAEEVVTEEVVETASESEEVVETEETTEEVVEEETPVVTAEATVEETKTETDESVAKTQTLLQQIVDKLDSLATIVKQAPTEGAADEKETSEEGAEVTEEVVEEAPAKEATEEASEEVTEETETAEETPADEVAKSDTSSEGASNEAMEKLEKAYDAKLTERDTVIEALTKRLETLENSPAPSKVVVSKQQADEKAAKLRKLEDRLEDIAKVRDTDPESYRAQRLDEEAISLIKAKKALREQE